MTLGEYGVIFHLDANFDMSGWTGLMLTFTDPDGNVFTRTNPAVTLGTVDIDTDRGKFLANQYVDYTFVASDLSVAGDWQVYLTYDAGPNLRLISQPPFAFKVDNPSC